MAGEELLRGEFAAISNKEAYFQEISEAPKSRIFFRDLSWFLWPGKKPYVPLAETASISERMARYLLRLDCDASERVRQAVLDEVRARMQP